MIRHSLRAAFGLILVLAIASSIRALGSSAAAGEPSFTHIADLPSQCQGDCSLRMVDLRSGWLYKRSAVWFTTDGGISWRQRSLPVIGSGDYADVHFLDKIHGWLFTASQRLYETSDGGAQWVAQTTPETDGVLQAAWVFPETGSAFMAGGVYRRATSPDAPNYALRKYESGEWGVLRPVVYHRETATGGWQERPIPLCSWTIVQLTFVDEKRGFALGDGCYYYTDTGGELWAAAIFHSGGMATTSFGGGATTPSVGS